MSKISWKAVLEWGDDELDDLRLAGYAYIQQGKYEIALPFFEALHVLDPMNAYDIQTLGALYLEMNNPEEARKALQKALSLDGDHAPTLLNLAKALFLLKKNEEALRLAELLEHEKEPAIACVAAALLLAHGAHRMTRADAGNSHLQGNGPM